MDEHDRTTVAPGGESAAPARCEHRRARLAAVKFVALELPPSPVQQEVAAGGRIFSRFGRLGRWLAGLASRGTDGLEAARS